MPGRVRNERTRPGVFHPSSAGWTAGCGSTTIGKPGVKESTTHRSLVFTGLLLGSMLSGDNGLLWRGVFVAAGLLGRNLQGSGVDFDVEVREGDGQPTDRRPHRRRRALRDRLELERR